MTGEHDELRDAAGAWVLGALDEDDAWRFAAHLEVCASCRTEVARLQVAADALALAAPPLEPPAALRERIMAVVEEESRGEHVIAKPSRKMPAPARWRSWLAPRTALASGLAALLLVAGGAAGFTLRGGGEGRVVVAPRAHVIPASVDAGDASNASAQLVQLGSRGVLQVSHMPPPSDGHVYQVWVARPGTRALDPDAVFTVDRNGRGSVAIMDSVHGATAVEVTEEPQGGSLAPTRRPLLVVHPN